MSIDTNFYIGVYLVVDQFIEDTETKRVCENGHQNYHDKFCTKCGTEFKNKEFPRTKRMTWYDAVEEFDCDVDTFRNVDRGDDPHIWIANGGSLVYADNGDYAEEINPDTIAASVKWFKETYRTELALLEGNGVEYEMLYGAVVFYS
jgi:hypothetical protein